MKIYKNICGLTKHIKSVPLLTYLLTCVVVASLAGCGEESVHDQAYTAQDDAATTTQAGAAAQSVSSPGTLSTESPFGMHPASVKGGSRDWSGDSFSTATDMGVGWAREGVYAFWFLIQPDLSSTDYDFSLHDQQWGSVPANIRILGNISPQGPRDEGRCLKGSFMPVDEAKYAAFVRATIERYDGDGVDDMPGLTNPIKYWQVGNEPDGSRVKDFASLQRITYTAIKTSCADCVVLIGGVPGFPSDYISNFDSDYAPILKELNGKYVDVFDFHWYGLATGDYRLDDPAVVVANNTATSTNSSTGGAIADAMTSGSAAPDSADVLAHIQQTLSADGFPADMPIWITEMGTYSGDPSEADSPPGRQEKKVETTPQTERQQAQDCFKRFIYPLSRGVGKVFLAFGLMEGFQHKDGYFDHTGLIYNGEGAGDPGRGVKKLSYYTYKKMSEKLNGADWSTITTLHDGTGGDHLYLFRVMKDEEEIYVAWWDYYDEAGYRSGDTKNIRLDEIDASMATITRVVPRAGSGQQVEDYATAFETLETPIEDGGLDVALGEDPVIIEVSSPELQQ